MTAGSPQQELQATADVVVEADSVLGEGPVWDAADGTLLWIDILADRVHRSDLGRGATTTIQADRTVGAIAPRADGGLIAAVPGGFGSLGADGTVRMLATLEADRPANRMNDGKVAPDGSFWAGTMDRSAEPGAGSLYRLAPDLSVSVVLTGLTVSNGIGWSPDGALCYFVDTADQGIDVVREEDSGVWSRTPFVRIDRALGVPDGLTVDAAGNVWVAMCFGGRVLCYAPDGSPDRHRHGAGAAHHVRRLRRARPGRAADHDRPDRPDRRAAQPRAARRIGVRGPPRRHRPALAAVRRLAPYAGARSR